MEANTYSKYALKDLYDAIDLIDRKINYCKTLETEPCLNRARSQNRSRFPSAQLYPSRHRRGEPRSRGSY